MFEFAKRTHEHNERRRREKKRRSIDVHAHFIIRNVCLFVVFDCFDFMNRLETIWITGYTEI